MIYQFQPKLKETPWGGDRLWQLKGLPTPIYIGESWELSDMPGMESVVACGEEKGLTLSQLIARHGANLLGRRGVEIYGGRFPLLVKLIDSRQWLSLQVHPNDVQARELETEEVLGKHETWHVIDSTPESSIIYGFKPGVDSRKYCEAEGSNRLLDIVEKISVAPGMQFVVSPGTIHAIGPGCLVAEVQQPSDITYRVYDYGRARELHLEKARRTLNFTNEQTGSYYSIDYNRLGLNEPKELKPIEGSFTAVMILRGSGKLDSLAVKSGETLLISADHGPASLKAGADGLDYLTIAV